MVIEILISISAVEGYHEDVLECLEQFSIMVEVTILSNVTMEFYDGPKWSR